MAKIQDVITAQNKLAKEIKEVFTNFASKPKEKRYIGSAKSQLQRLEEYYNSFMANHAQALKCKDYDPALDYFTSTFTDDVEDEYYDSKGDFNKVIFDLEHSHALSLTIRHSTMLSTSSSSHNLPPMKIPEFSGRYTEWETYRDLFITVVDNAEKATNVEKFSYLLMERLLKLSANISFLKQIIKLHGLIWYLIMRIKGALLALI